MSMLEITPILRVVNNANLEKPFRFFGQIGYGMYRTKGKISTKLDDKSFSGSNTKNRQGMNLGLGVLINQFTESQLEVYPNMDIIFDDNETVIYYSINFGLYINY